MDLIRNPIVFLHIPKTAGQTVHNALARAVGASRVSPVRVHTQAAGGAGQFPAGHALYSGHLDWDGIDSLPIGRFTFTVLRAPKERIASFYFYLRREAERLSPEELAAPENIGRRRALHWSAEDYFLGGDEAWQGFLRDHYDNFYCSYFGTGRYRGAAEFRTLSDTEALSRAAQGLARIDGVFRTDALDRLERVLDERYGFRLQLADRFDNAGDARTEPRWPRLLDRLGSDKARRTIEAFAERDAVLFDRQQALA
ncbi:MAG: hypothetical protein DI533_04465 [Cereibacter sphaeroides]|uniref:Sulfotransferase family protein n=1 Tax=Cereibacter sphaeroides TaxID=1063 RepID=A0A2W5SJP8_CERSP|nr:MAG: hypothetical protein DI533_04465 [Cereibacter sphaeroides]